MLAKLLNKNLIEPKFELKESLLELLVKAKN
jgi:hypothetical protein